MFALARRPRTTALVSGVAAALLLGTAAPAAATASPAAPLVGLDQAFADLPVAKVLPGAVTLSLKVEEPASADLEPCPQTGADVALKAGEVGALYVTANHRTPAAKTVQWSVSVLVFHTAKLATSAAARLVKAEKACPTTLPDDGNGDGLPFTRTTSKAYALGAWAGYRSVDEISTLDLIDGPYPIGVRLSDVYLTHGNLMLHVQEQGDLEPGTGPRQDAWRKTVTQLMIADLAATVKTAAAP